MRSTAQSQAPSREIHFAGAVGEGWRHGLAVLLVFVLSVTVCSAQRKPKGKGGKIMSPGEAAAVSKQKAQIRIQLNSLHSDMHNVKGQIHSAKVKENVITETIEQVSARINTTQARLTKTNSRIERLENEHDEVTNRLQDTEIRLKKRRGLLAERIRETYRRGDTNYLQVLLQARSMAGLSGAKSLCQADCQKRRGTH